MMRQVILDTGPLVAFLDTRGRVHEWAMAPMCGNSAAAFDVPSCGFRSLLSSQRVAPWFALHS
ncbi:hypothetical protein DSTSK_28280 [Desulforhabdus sp. TSK]|nr:hypothetical protein DSTSK_28280 [Desulforhabdus sp. TSK]